MVRQLIVTDAGGGVGRSDGVTGREGGLGVILSVVDSFSEARGPIINK